MRFAFRSDSPIRIFPVLSDFSSIHSTYRSLHPVSRFFSASTISGKRLLFTQLFPPLAHGVPTSCVLRDRVFFPSFFLFLFSPPVLAVLSRSRGLLSSGEAALASWNESAGARMGEFACTACRARPRFYATRGRKGARWLVLGCLRVSEPASRFACSGRNRVVPWDRCERQTNVNVACLLSERCVSRCTYESFPEADLVNYAFVSRFSHNQFCRRMSLLASAWIFASIRQDPDSFILKVAGVTLQQWKMISTRRRGAKLFTPRKVWVFETTNDIYK